MIALCMLYLRALAQPAMVAITVTAGLLAGTQGAVLATGTVTVLDIIAVRGPNAGNPSLTDFLPWLTLPLIAVFWAGRLFGESLGGMRQEVMMRVGKRRKWLSAYYLVFALFATFYTLLTTLSITVGMLAGALFSGSNVTLFADITLNDQTSIAGSSFWLTYVLLNAGTLYILLVVQHLVSVYWQSPIVGLWAVVIMTVVTWLTGPYQTAQLLLPPAQSMIVRHTPFFPLHTVFTTQWSLVYIGVVSILCMVLGFVLVKHIDITY